MASYKVSYKVLRQQGEDIKAAAKLVDGYAERVGQIRGKLGSDGLLAEGRGNLQKLQAQLGESRAVLNAAGEFLVKTVESYSGTETRQVKKVDGTKAHNRDFYKNPVVVASAGGAAGAASSPAAPVTTVNYTDNSVNITYAAPESAAAASAPDVQPVSSQTAAASEANASPAASAAPVPQPTGANAAGIAAAGVLGGAAAAGAVAGGLHLKRRRGVQKENAAEVPSDDGYDPEAELEKAIARVRELEEEESE